ncbi:CPBP family intramembrane glutamic endopeptidase [Nocardia sp. NPDC101769]|uniref:CPBP family intramembrane glutamic endopeptidase n=1 Tax=Nocardia sp. NPDC101769 TaxID=3364333 RepID=UPI0038201E2A
MSTRSGLLSAAVLVPLFGAALPEEVLFRSLPLSIARHWPRRYVLIVVVSAGLLALFAFTHMQYGWLNVISASVGGAIYTALATYTGVEEHRRSTLETMRGTDDFEGSPGRKHQVDSRYRRIPRHCSSCPGEALR